MYEALNCYDVDLRFIHSWYLEIVNSLRLIKSKSAGIKHPRHLGDFLESELASILRRVLPQKYMIEKGFLINRFSAFSQEQDLLLMDTALGSAICKTDNVGYYPIECALGSIEVKSNLDLSELRKCFVSCANAKKLFFQPFQYDCTLDESYFYAIFAYTSGCTKKSFERELNSCLDATPEALRPNHIYILDQGLYFPTSAGQIRLGLESIQNVREGYKMVPNNANSESESQNFYLYLANIIEHVFHQSGKRRPTEYSSYSITPTLWRSHLEEERGQDSTPVRKFINPHTRWSEKLGGELLVIYEEKCPKCGADGKFYPLPPGSTKAREKLAVELEKQGCVPLPKSKKFTCGCGQTYEIKEAK